MEKTCEGHMAVPMILSEPSDGKSPSPTMEDFMSHNVAQKG